MNTTLKYLLTLTTITWVSIWSAWVWFGRNVFELGQSFALFLFPLFILIVRPQWKITKVTFAIATNQLVDELFFNPYQISWNEYLTMFVVILVIYFNTFFNKLISKIFNISLK